jgi:hypothetical protein
MSGIQTGILGEIIVNDSLRKYLIAGFEPISLKNLYCRCGLNLA